jgi:hypothetical protein
MNKKVRKMSPRQIDKLSTILAKQIKDDIFERKYAPVKEVLKLVGMGLFMAGAITFRKLPKSIEKLFIEDEYEVYKRFNIPYLKRTLERLQRQKLVEIGEIQGKQIVKITEAGKERILKYALDELAVKKPRIWNELWYIVSYDIPEYMDYERRTFRSYLRAWGFYRLQHSVYLHAYPCKEQVEFLREYLGISKFVSIFTVTEIENNRAFRDYFGL